MYHLIVLFLSFPYEQFIETDPVFADHAAADVSVCFLLGSLIYWYPAKLFAKIKMVSYMLVLGCLLQYQTQYLFELCLLSRFEVTSNVFSLSFKLPLETSILFAALVDRERHWVHIKVNR